MSALTRTVYGPIFQAAFRGYSTSSLRGDQHSIDQLAKRISQLEEAKVIHRQKLNEKDEIIQTQGYQRRVIHAICRMDHEILCIQLKMDQMRHTKLPIRDKVNEH